MQQFLSTKTRLTAWKSLLFLFSLTTSSLIFLSQLGQQQASARSVVGLMHSRANRLLVRCSAPENRAPVVTNGPSTYTRVTLCQHVAFVKSLYCPLKESPNASSFKQFSCPHYVRGLEFRGLRFVLKSNSS